MDFLDTLARVGRARAPDPELRYHGGPLDGQADTWPIAAVPPRIQVARADGWTGGAYVLSGGADDPDFYYRWIPAV
ncbi:hypothetical protein GCM10020000_85140 [Streptomyces olivoverticillatus]